MTAGTALRGSQAFRHDALLYAGDEQFLAGAVPFIRSALAAEDPILVVIGGAKIRLLRSELGDDAQHVQFGDMNEIGSNPARIIPAWRDFVAGRDHRRVWGIGEPIWAERSPAELVECQRHESLLNLAFADARAFSLLCPYDTSALDADVIAEAHRSHPAIVEAGARRPSHAYCGLDAVVAPFATPLPEPRGEVRERTFEGAELGVLRRFVDDGARAAGLGASRREDLVLAANEVATNSVRYGGGSGTLRLWAEDTTVLCEIRDRGRLDDPMAGRQRPEVEDIGGYGLWLANQVCDLVQVRSLPDGSVVRLHVRAH